jgi:hypothetical protein
MSSDHDLSDYREVRERLAAFHERHRSGRVVALDPQWIEGNPAGPGWLVTAEVYRTDDPHEYAAGRGSSFLACPGRTAFTKWSEVENAETSAVGRALAFAGFAASRSIASADDVRRARAEELGVPRAEAKGRLLAACQGRADLAGEWGALAGLDRHGPRVPLEALEVLEAICAGTYAPVEPVEAPESPSTGLGASESTTTPQPAPTTGDAPPAEVRAELEETRLELSREELVARARADVAAAAAAHNHEGNPQ